MTVRDRLVKAATIVAVLTVVSKSLGFFREASLAAVFGATHATDAYLVAQTIPGLIFSSVGMALGTTFIPVYAQVRRDQGTGAAFAMANSVINATIVLGFAFVALGEVFAVPLARLVAPGFHGPVYDLTVWLSRVMFPMVIFEALSGLVSGLLQSEGNFTVPAGVGVGFNFIIISAILGLGPRFGISSVAAGTVLAVGAQVAWQWPALRRSGFHWRPTLEWRDPGLRRIWQLAGPILIASSVAQIGLVVDRILASGLFEGSVAALNYANRLMVLVPNILGSAIVTVIYPTLARYSANGEWDRYTASLGESVRLINLLLVPVTVGMAVLSAPFVRLAFERGAFDSRATAATAWALLYFAPATAGMALRDMLSRAFFAFQDTTAPTVTAVIAVAINVILDLALVGTLKQGGLALQPRSPSSRTRA
ncbi:MAG: murein biosynthesis integral membrane protein MurJ [Bacteroidota bacterium]